MPRQWWRAAQLFLAPSTGEHVRIGLPPAPPPLTPLSSFLLQATGPSGSKMQLLETEFSRSVPELIELHLLQQDSIPAFLSALTIELFSRQTSM